MASKQKNVNSTAGEIYNPPSHVKAGAHVKEYKRLYQRSLDDPSGFWAERAEELGWFEPWTKVIDDSQKPFFKWFVGGKTNIVHNAPDRRRSQRRVRRLQR